MTIHSLKHARVQRGFSLIEVLIGLLIAMIGVVIMMEVLITSEQRARTTSSGNDATSGGAVMMHLMQRDMVQAGFGINSVNLLGCNLTLPTGKTITLAPLVINPPTSLVAAADANTDRIVVFYGSDNGQPEGNEVFTPNATTYSMQAPTSFSKDDYVVAYPGSCAANLTLAKVNNDVTALEVPVDFIDPSAKTLYNMGKAPRVVAYAVRNGALTTCDLMNPALDCSSASAANWTAVGGNIVALRSQYGRDTAVGAMDGQIDTWDQTTPTTSCGWVRAAAFRYVIVARSTQYETKIDSATRQRVCEPVTGSQPAWQGSATAPITAPGTDWQCYRYRTFENIAPSRNVIWMESNAGC